MSGAATTVRQNGVNECGLHLFRTFLSLGLELHICHR